MGLKKRLKWKTTKKIKKYKIKGSLRLSLFFSPIVPFQSPQMHVHIVALHHSVLDSDNYLIVIASPLHDSTLSSTLSNRNLSTFSSHSQAHRPTAISSHSHHIFSITSRLILFLESMTSKLRRRFLMEMDSLHGNLFQGNSFSP